MVPNPLLREKLRALPERLQQAVIGQDDAVALVSQRLQHGELGLTTRGRPKASFLFLGPTGVGKTELSFTFPAELLGPNTTVSPDMSGHQSEARLRSRPCSS